MDKQTIENLLKFLQRVDLKGNEVPAFLECTQKLNNLLQEEKKEKKDSK